MADIASEQTQGANSAATMEPVGSVADAKHQGIFDKQFKVVMDIFGKACEEAGIDTAIAIAKAPGIPQPLVFVRGHLYDVTALGNQVVSQMRSDLIESIT